MHGLNRVNGMARVRQWPASAMTRHSEATIARERFSWTSRRCSMIEASDTKIARSGDSLENGPDGHGR